METKKIEIKLTNLNLSKRYLAQSIRQVNLSNKNPPAMLCCFINF